MSSLFSVGGYAPACIHGVQPQACQKSQQHELLIINTVETQHLVGEISTDIFSSSFGVRAGSGGYGAGAGSAAARRGGAAAGGARACNAAGAGLRGAAPAAALGAAVLPQLVRAPAEPALARRAVLARCVHGHVLCLCAAAEAAGRMRARPGVQRMM